jgi:hypothetical protein
MHFAPVFTYVKSVGEETSIFGRRIETVHKSPSLDSEHLYTATALFSRKRYLSRDCRHCVSSSLQKNPARYGLQEILTRISLILYVLIKL